MSGRRYPAATAVPATEVTRTPSSRKVRAHAGEGRRKPKHPDEGIVNAVADVAVRAVGILAEACPGQSYALVRGIAVHALYAETACARGMRVAPIAMVMPDLPTEITAALFTLFGQLPLATLTPEHFGAAHEALSGYGLRDGAVVPTNGRRMNGVHFTPQSIAEPLVRRTLEPIFAVVPPEQTLSLRVCDPAMGGGALLVEAARQFGERVLGAGLAAGLDEAKRLASIHCLYGTDVCRFAVQATKLALTLECRADRMPVGWLDDNIKRGDALVGLTRDQIAAFHWKPQPPKDLLEDADRKRLGALVDDAINAGAAARTQRMAHLATLARGGAP